MVAKALRHFFNISIGMPFVHKMYGRKPLWIVKHANTVNDLIVDLVSSRINRACVHINRCLVVCEEFARVSLFATVPVQ